MIPIKINDPAGVTFAKGFKAAGIVAGLKKSGNKDLTLIYTETPAAVAGTFTQNKVAAAPVHVSKLTVKNGTAHAVISNAGCANACTGDEGLKNAHIMGEVTAKTLGCKPEEVIVGSTGVIGVQLPMDTITAGIPKVAAELSPTGSADASAAILTTDTKSKTATATFTVGGKEVHIGGIAKGSGMIRPNMATMLCYITTDLAITPALLQKALSAAVNLSFNMISVDGDMSTNDMCIVLANGLAGNDIIDTENEDFETVKEVLKNITIELAKQIAADGEGAGKFITINIHNAVDFNDAKTVGMAVANSPLVKTAFFGEDPNWGRIICAVGYSGANMVPEKTTLSIGGIPIFTKGMGTDYDEAALRAIMAEHDIVVDIDLNQGTESATVWTCDLTYGYVKINGEYHT